MNNSPLLLDQVHIEFEARKSDFLDIALRGPRHLQASTLKFWFDEPSMMDLLYSKNLTQDARLHV